MTARDYGFLLLTSHLGDPGRKPLTVAQFRELTRRARGMERPLYDRELTARDLTAIGCDLPSAQRVLDLLNQQEQLAWYLSRGQKVACYPITRLGDLYPQRVRNCLNLEAPGSLWAKGDLSLLAQPTVSLVGSRELKPENHSFAYEVGRQAALQGYTLVSGNAKGADRTAQSACLENGGSVIIVVADALEKQTARPGVLYLSEEGYDLPFSSQRALSRNRIIHTLSQQTFVAQCTMGRGGTWDGTVKNLRFGWSAVLCFADSSEAMSRLLQMGAQPVEEKDLQDISALHTNTVTLF